MRKWWPQKVVAWQSDAVLQLLRTSGDNLVLGNWENGAEKKDVPISKGINRLPVVRSKADEVSYVSGGYQHIVGQADQMLGDDMHRDSAYRGRVERYGK